MEFYEPNNVPGKYPEFGAIFMSNRATREECFRRKLLGLPSGQADFVKQVKSGMILFLFEFERRELHGVFQACSDGTVNIVPQAYRSSGKQFPAQVKFIQLTLISKEQFVVSSSEVGGLAEDARVVRSNMVENDQDVDIESRTNVLTDHHGCSITTSIRSSDYVNFATSYGLGQELVEDNGFQQPSTEHTGMFQSNPGLAEDARVVTHNMVGNGHDGGIESRTDVPTNHHRHSFDPDVPRPGNRCSSSRGLSNSVPEFPASHSFAIHSFDQSFHPHMEPEGTSSHLNINASLSDYILLSNANQHDHLNRPDMFFPGDDYPSHAARTSFMNGNTGHRRSPSSFELYNSVPQCPPHNIFSAFVNESFPSYIEPKSTSECQNLNSLLFSDSPSSHPGHHDHANRTSMLYPGAAYPENVQRNSSGIEWTREDNSACSCSLNRSSSFVSAGRYSVSSQEELVHQMSQLENDEALSVSVPRLKHHENGLINLVTRENSERMFSDHQKRKSVFSRLAFSSEACKQEEYDVDSSVDELSVRWNELL
ncbi:DCD (DEVELOPMENT AND CELL DEATH) DOMAIN PROTEIN-RELATED [Salix viminalis]|uniref:DCD (DEVELOPMENT AND CELL DEATH) DOMAIN PROTEIN-RELATED n=1 Tax=Salix viminalis TaxID=40686 RepID=A0A9Q0NUP2_SALVM|nr:DCD (DEVELOPMENT AND CELL DEATH) DOMAIN PROTEIN-RELATED [Salix viminalis]